MMWLLSSNHLQKNVKINEENNIKKRTMHILFAFLLFAQIVNTALDGDLGESDILYFVRGHIIYSC